MIIMARRRDNLMQVKDALYRAVVIVVHKSLEMHRAKVIASRLLPQSGPSGPGPRPRKTSTATMAGGAE